MVQYIVKIAEEMRGHAERGELGEAMNLRGVLAEELDRLDPRDFLPAAQFKFVIARRDARQWALVSNTTSENLPYVKGLASRVLETLAEYGGLGSKATFRSFAFIIDSGLRRIIERDYRELSLNVFPSGSWKSTVVLAGSILEAILFDQLSGNAANKARALNSARSPKDRSGTTRDLDSGNWRLFDLIEVAADIGVLPSDRAKSIDQILRDYRNYVHPKKEIRAKYPCTEAEAMLAMGALEAVCNVLTP